MALSDVTDVRFRNTLIVRKETEDICGVEIAQVDKVILNYRSTEEINLYMGSVCLAARGTYSVVCLTAADIPKVIEYLQGVLKEHNETKN